MQWARGRHLLDVVDEPSYSFRSTDNLRSYPHEYLLADQDVLTSKHGVTCSQDGTAAGAALVGASAGPTWVHQRSAVLLDEVCFVAVGNRVACLGLPLLELLWHEQADTATCFGLHLAADEKYLLVHGELEITRLTLEGRKEWSFTGADIFSGDFRLTERTVEVTDFNGQGYVVDVRTGVGRAPKSRWPR